MTVRSVGYSTSRTGEVLRSAYVWITFCIDRTSSLFRYRRTETVAFVVAAVTCGGCATNMPPLTIPADSTITIAVPVLYKDAFGVGSGTVEGAVEMAKGTEARVASRAIVLSLQELETNLKSPRLGAGEMLPQKVEWISDRAPVPAIRIRDHNALNPEMKFAEQYRYQLEFIGEYVVDRGELIFRISARIFESGSASEQREYKQPYSGKFFVNSLGKLIREKLLEQNSGISR